MSNPLLYLKKENLVDFGLINATHFAPAVNQLLADYAKVIAEVCEVDKVTWDNLIAPLDESYIKFSVTWHVISHLANVVSTEQIRQEHEKLLPIVSKFYSDVMHNEKLFAQFKKLAQSSEYQKLNSTQQYILQNQLRDFELSGVGLEPAAKAQYSKILADLAQITNKFGSNVLDATYSWELHLTENEKERLQGIPEHIIHNAMDKARQKNKTGYILGIDQPTYVGIISYCADRQLREQVYNAYVCRASEVNGPELDNTPLIAQILKMRQELAQIVGFNNYAEYSLATKVAKKPQTVLKFLYDIGAKAKEPAGKQLQALTEFAHSLGFQGKLEAYDIPYYAQKYQELTYHLNQEELRPYFPSDKVMQGIFSVAEKLYGIQIQEITSQFSAELWHPDVKMYAVYENHVLIGYFYADLYAREHKHGGAWMDNLFERLVFKDGKVQIPVCILSCNFAKPMPGKPGLLTHEEVETAFHEFGHCLHGLLTKVKYLGASGMNGVPWDCVELPSQFFENWAWQYDVIKQISGHYLTGEVLPEDIFVNLLKTKVYNSGLMILRQLEMGLFDMLIHTNLPENQGKSAQQILDEVREKIAVVKPPTLNKFQNSFTHIFDGGYAAGYYSYLWADVLSCDAFSYFAKHGLYNQKYGRAFKEHILEKGGSDDFMVLYKNYAQQEPDIMHLLEHYALI